MYNKLQENVLDGIEDNPIVQLFTVKSLKIHELRWLFRRTSVHTT
jgi:hypothetical protein